MNIDKILKDGKIYEIDCKNKIGEGSYSNVYLGKMTCNGNEIIVAVKKINKIKMSLKGINMLMTEIEIITKLLNNNHENIIKCYDVIEETNNIYIISEYCENGELTNILMGKEIKYDYVKYYFGQIMKAIKYLHENKIIHRDMKPKNILLTNNFKTIKLCDFGFAKYSVGLKRSMTVCGSPLYMAPEIYQKIGYMHSVDIWAIGLILYEMLFALHPLNELDDPLKLANTIINIDIKIPKNENIENECIDILEKMLKRNEIERINLDELLENKWIIECMTSKIEKINSIDEIYKKKECEYENNNMEKNCCGEKSEISLIFEMD